MFADIESLEVQVNAADEDLRALVQGIDEQAAQWTPVPGSWSIAQCIDHLAVTNQVYLAAMQQAAVRARVKGRVRRRAAVPGMVGGWFASQLEPPVKAGRKFRSTRNIQPRPSPPLADAYGDLVLAQQRVGRFIQENADLDLAGVRFANPIIRGLRFSLASGLHIILAHERRHLWQAKQVLRAYSIAQIVPRIESASS